MKILSSGDHHFDEHGRLDECVEIHQWLVELAKANEVDAFVSCGDIYERASTPRERQLVADFLTAMAEVCHVFVARGNHDRHLDCQIMARLRSKYPIVVEEAAGVHYVGDTAIALIAWPERARLLQQAPGSQEADNLAETALQHLFMGLGQQLGAHSGPKLAFGHLMIDGSVTSVGQPLIGMPMRITLSDLALLHADLVVAGHIHKPQAWQIGTTDVLYTGSPYRTSFGECEDKSVVLIETHPSGVVTWDRITTPCQDMHLLSTSWADGDWAVPPDELVAVAVGGGEWSERSDVLHGSAIRFRYEVPVDQRVAARAAADALRSEWLQAGAAEVKIEDVTITLAVARAPEVAQAQTIGDKLHALWKARDTIPTPERASELISKASGLEQELR